MEGAAAVAGAAAGEAARFQPLRFVEIKLLEWVAALVLLLRLAALPAALLAGLAALRRWAAAAALHTWATRAVQIALIGVPCANLIAGALAAALGLPDDAALRAPALASAAGTLLCLLLVEACAAEAQGPAPAAPEPT